MHSVPWDVTLPSLDSFAGRDAGPGRLPLGPHRVGHLRAAPCHDCIQAQCLIVVSNSGGEHFHFPPMAFQKIWQTTSLPSAQTRHQALCAPAQKMPPTRRLQGPQLKPNRRLTKQPSPRTMTTAAGRSHIGGGHYTRSACLQALTIRQRKQALRLAVATLRAVNSLLGSRAQRAAAANTRSGKELPPAVRSRGLLHPNMRRDPIANLALATRIPGCVSRQLDTKPL